MLQKVNSRFLRVTVALATMAFLGSGTQAWAAGKPAPIGEAGSISSVAGVAISAKADKNTRAIAQAQPAALKATANLCGAGYKLYSAERLPDANRFATLFIYANGGYGPDNTMCAIMDNNVGTAKWMKLSVCENKSTNPRCHTDQGIFSQYAGPVYMNNCAKVTALMKYKPSDTVYIVNAVRGSFCG
ncbi:hypothetical protein [Streptomyces sp. DSM 40907]|uniref:hypothetical protein n=1 Tax=Streptomyces kutzneri TaxID=3051179 RepID=UPI0028D686B0|nr:hypothetical protein [Streptomyces sp. DSM 40907]